MCSVEGRDYYHRCIVVNQAMESEETCRRLWSQGQGLEPAEVASSDAFTNQAYSADVQSSWAPTREGEHPWERVRSTGKSRRWTTALGGCSLNQFGKTNKNTQNNTHTTHQCGLRDKGQPFKFPGWKLWFLSHLFSRMIPFLLNFLNRQ